MPYVYPKLHCHFTSETYLSGISRPYGPYRGPALVELRFFPSSHRRRCRRLLSTYHTLPSYTPLPLPLLIFLEETF